MLPLACFSGTWTGSYSVAPGWVQNTQHDSTYVSFFEQRSTLTTDLTTPISVASTASSLSTAYPETDAYGILVAPKQTFGITDSNSGSTWPGPLTLPWPKGAPNGGDLEIACVENQAHVVPNTPPGWTAAYTSAGDLFGTGLFYKYASVGEPASVSFTLPVQGNISAAIVHVEGNDVHLGFRGFTHTGFGAVTNVAAQVPVDPNHGGMLALACFSGVWTTSYSGAPGWVTDTQSNGTYVSFFEHRTRLTDASDLQNGTINVPSTASSIKSNYAQTDAYGILVTYPLAP